MTDRPNPETPASSSPRTTEHDPADLVGAAPQAPQLVDETHGQDGVLDAGTYDAVREPRSANRLPLGDGTWHQISPKYVRVQFIANGAFLVGILAVALILALVLHQVWVWIPAGILTVILVWTLAILPRQARAYGYQLRDDDLVFRRGILWQRMVAVPYGRMQLVDITHGPLDRGFGIAQLKLVTAAAVTGVTIPGLTQAAAEQLRDTLIDVAETRRTGL
ncbi:PH domain-containing protein [Microbacterium sp.]|uniref:PH domain-containing protein n=1 Tax=Microbacterium sp. TaxID=51671 RepID=UPI003221A356